jgi:hypothetical protein
MALGGYTDQSYHFCWTGENYMGWQDISRQGFMIHGRAANQTKGESAVTWKKGNYIN